MITVSKITSILLFRELLLVPLSRDDYVEYDWSMKVVSDINPSMKLVLTGLIGKQYTMQQNWSYSYLRDGDEIADVFDEGRLGPLFGTGYFSLANIGHNSYGAKFTHMVNKKDGSLPRLMMVVPGVSLQRMVVRLCGR